MTKSHPKGKIAKGPTKLSRSVNHAIASLHEGDEANSLSTGRYKANYLTGVKMYGSHFNPGVVHKESSRVAIAPLSSRIKWKLLRSTQPIMDIDNPTLKDDIINFMRGYDWINNYIGVHSTPYITKTDIYKKLKENIPNIS